MSEPRISVVMPVRDGRAMIEQQLAALAGQTVDAPWELIVVDNGSRDGTAELVLAWEERIPALRVVEGPAQPAVAASTNLGVARAQAPLLAFCDHDDICSERWVEAMLAALTEHAHVCGPLELRRLNPPRVAWGEHVTSWMTGPVPHPFLPFAMTCNAGWRRDLLESLGGFDESLPAGHDRDLSWRTQLAGHQLAFAEDAIVHRRQRHDLGAAFQQHVRHGRTERRLIARFEPLGARGPSRLQVIRSWLELLARLPWLAQPSRRLRWVETLGVQIGSLQQLSGDERRVLQEPILGIRSAPAVSAGPRSGRNSGR